jgi:hypothetical protein
LNKRLPNSTRSRRGQRVELGRRRPDRVSRRAPTSFPAISSSGLSPLGPLMMPCPLWADFVAKDGCDGWMLVGRFTNGDRLCPPAPRRSLRNSYATQHTAHERVAVAQPTTRAAAGSGRWQQGQTRPGHLAVRRDCSKPSVPANDRATSRACSWISRGILRDGSFGQHCGLSGHRSQSSLLARYRSVLPSCTVPLVPSRFPAGQW